MAKKKKNNNYVTDKRVAAQAEKDKARKDEKKTKKIKQIALWVAIPVLIVAVVIGALFLGGAFDYAPETTHHAEVSIEGYDSFFIYLYGEDAPETVEHFANLCEDGYFDGKELHTLTDGLLYGGSETADGGKNGIKGEFSSNGFDNKVSIKKGVIAMARGTAYDSAYGQFFFATKDATHLNGDYAAFGRISDTSVLEKIVAEFDENNPPKITGITLHSGDHHH